MNTIRREEWFALNRAQRHVEIAKRLQELYDIEQGKHPLSGTKEQGQLTDIKVAHEKFILSTVDWEQAN